MKFEVVTPLGFTVRTSEGYWQRLMGKHPDLEELEELVTLTLASPDEIRRSSHDACYSIASDRKNVGLWQWLGV